MPTMIEDHQRVTYETAYGMLRRGQCSTDVIVGYLGHALERDAESDQ